MNSLVISTLVLTLVGFVVSTTPAEQVCNTAAAASKPVTGTITQATAGGDVCCTVQTAGTTANYYCQSEATALATGGLLNKLTGELKLTGLVCGVLNLVDLSAPKLISCINKTGAVTCTPPTVPAGSTTTNWCNTGGCTAGACCTIKCP